MQPDTFHYYAHRIGRDTYLGKSYRTTPAEILRAFPTARISGNCVAVTSETGICKALESVFIVAPGSPEAVASEAASTLKGTG